MKEPKRDLNPVRGTFYNSNSPAMEPIQNELIMADNVQNINEYDLNRANLAAGGAITAGAAELENSKFLFVNILEQNGTATIHTKRKALNPSDTCYLSINCLGNHQGVLVGERLLNNSYLHVAMELKARGDRSPELTTTSTDAEAIGVLSRSFSLIPHFFISTEMINVNPLSMTFVRYVLNLTYPDRDAKWHVSLEPVIRQPRQGHDGQFVPAPHPADSTNQTRVETWLLAALAAYSPFINKFPATAVNVTVNDNYPVPAQSPAIPVRQTAGQIADLLVQWGFSERDSYTVRHNLTPQQGNGVNFSKAVAAEILRDAKVMKRPHARSNKILSVINYGADNQMQFNTFSGIAPQEAPSMFSRDAQSPFSQMCTYIGNRAEHVRTVIPGSDANRDFCAAPQRVFTPNWAVAASRWGTIDLSKINFLTVPATEGQPTTLTGRIARIWNVLRTLESKVNRNVMNLQSNRLLNGHLYLSKQRIDNRDIVVAHRRRGHTVEACRTSIAPRDNFNAAIIKPISKNKKNSMFTRSLSLTEKIGALSDVDYKILPRDALCTFPSFGANRFKLQTDALLTQHFMIPERSKSKKKGTSGREKSTKGNLKDKKKNPMKKGKKKTKARDQAERREPAPQGGQDRQGQRNGSPRRGGYGRRRGG